MTTQTKQSHTAGPWHVEYLLGDTLVYAPDKDGKGQLICEVRLTHPNEMYERLYGNNNARLIAAAPEVLEAARIALDRFQTLIDADEATDNDFDARDKLETAIAKAKGS